VLQLTRRPWHFVAIVLGTLFSAMHGAVASQSSQLDVGEDARPAGDLGQLPSWHPAAGLRPGHVRVVGGVTLCRPVKGSPRAPLVTGVAEESQPDSLLLLRLSRSAMQLGLNSQEESLLADRLAFASWVSDQRNKQLAPSQQATMKEAYQRALKDAWQLRLQVAGKKTAADSCIQGLARIAFRLMRIEQNEFAKRGLRPPSGNIFRSMAPGPLTAADSALALKSLLDLLSGDYLVRERLAAKRARVNDSWSTMDSSNSFLRVAVPGSRIRPYEPGTSDTAGLSLVRVPCTATGTIRIRLLHGTTTTLGYELRIYTSEHDILDDTERSVLIPNHTNVVAGIWIHSKRQVTDVTYENCARAASVEKTIYDERFLSWAVGDGAAGDYQANDTLHLKASFWFSDYDDAYTFAMGVSGLAPGRIQVAAYSVGDYGLDWICHNAANAFTYDRWGLLVADDSYLGVILYSPFGDKGISPRTDTTGTTHVGCVPGMGCYYTTNIRYALGLFDALCSGTGTYLDTYYDAATGRMAASRASYKNEAIPFDGPSRSIELEGW
jgi:hypothetical protein